MNYTGKLKFYFTRRKTMLEQLTNRKTVAFHNEDFGILKHVNFIKSTVKSHPSCQIHSAMPRTTGVTR